MTGQAHWGVTCAAARRFRVQMVQMVQMARPFINRRYLQSCMDPASREPLMPSFRPAAELGSGLLCFGGRNRTCLSNARLQSRKASCFSPDYPRLLVSTVGGNKVASRDGDRGGLARPSWMEPESLRARSPRAVRRDPFLASHPWMTAVLLSG